MKAQEQVASLVNDFDSRYETIPAQYASNLNKVVDENQLKGSNLVRLLEISRIASPMF